VRKILVLVGLLCVIPVFAQETKAPANTAPSDLGPQALAMRAPALDAADKQLLTALEKAAKLADTRCKALDEYQVYDATQKAVATQIQTKYPDYVFDWNTRTLKPKAVK
jgi:hypothetical protein